MKFFSRVTALIFVSVLSLQTAAQEAAEDTPKKDGLDYIGINGLLIDHRSIGSSQTAKNWATSITMGTYITDYVKVETRFGKGLTDDDVKGVATLEVNWWASWFMGLHYPLAEWSSIYGQLGMSYVDGDASAIEGTALSDLDDDFLSSKFSMSWIAGLDFNVTEGWYVTAEAGRLHRGTASDINMMHYGLGLKYEF